MRIWRLLLLIAILLPVMPVQTAFGRAPRATSVTFFPDGKRLVETYTDGVVRITSVPDGKLLELIEASTVSVNRAAVSPDGSKLATANSDGTIVLWSTADWSKQNTITGHAKYLRSVAFSPDGRRLVSGGADSIVRCWDPATGSPIWEGKGHVAAINALTFSHDGKLLGSVADDGTVRIWDAGSGSEVATLIPPDSKNPRRTVAFSHDDRRIAAGDFFSTIVWDVASKSLAYKASGGLLAISFSPDGKRLALGQPEAVVLVDASSGATQSAYSPEEAHAGGANPVALAFSADWKWYAILPDRGSLFVGKIAEIDAKQAAEDCQYDEPRNPICLGTLCGDAKFIFKDGCVHVMNTSASPMAVAADMRCGEVTKFEVPPGQSAPISYLVRCVQTFGELKSIDINPKK
ncbi:MAG: WD40 repeat domain-containing protein [Hyphomicrobium sp.]|nr:WD40 repeat domain-containing protein [Hyphomicrobium sp.]